MRNTFVDANLLVWEVFPSGGDFGFPQDPQIVFNCLSNRMLRPRFVKHQGDEAEAARFVQNASTQQLRTLFETSSELD
ncbi:MAG TPA: hypothetical protein VF021_08590 [Longimicrobiales bacterium]